MNQVPKQLLAEPLPDNSGYTWTLTTRLGHMLRIAQDRFGERDKAYTILGIEFSQNGPQIWYPGNCGHIAIQLSLDCLNDEIRACYQLAHETIHLLSPTGKRNATLLEDGLATHFAHQYIREHLDSSYAASGLLEYDIAPSMIEKLLEVDENAVKKLRADQPIISLITKELILKYYPDFPESIAEDITKRFKRRGNNDT